MRAVERGGGRGRREKWAYSHRSENNSPVLCPEDRRCCLLSLRVERVEEGGLTFTCCTCYTYFPSSLLHSSTQPIWSCRGLSARTDEAQDQSAGRASVPIAPTPCTVLLSLTHAHQNAFKSTHSDNFPLRTHTHMLTDSQAGTPPPIICVASSSAHIGVSSEGLCFALHQQQQ